jgi:hypothetical protein
MFTKLLKISIVSSSLQKTSRTFSVHESLKISVTYDIDSCANDIENDLIDKLIIELPILVNL